MDYNTIVTLIGSVGFPIVCCGALLYFMIKQTENHKVEMKALTDAHREEIDKLTEMSRTETQKLTEAVNNNTLIITRLSERLGVIFDE